ncbi:hypothetical protein AB0C86_07355 [Streptomyces lavendulae]|uniref:hypothetical protein n=1 Tax=Streptomyces lavendulae TaxID=1914 RepID=UPI0024A2E2DB|nr:hypothetical protein [Streptomyces lavendulae]GLW02179.1 hypothetical protein Slala05_58090 [Streptomyces lavendulae subsp. lavendulae]
MAPGATTPRRGPSREYALARDPELDRHVADLEARAADAMDVGTAHGLLDAASRVRHPLRALEPGE